MLWRCDAEGGAGVMELGSSAVTEAALELIDQAAPGGSEFPIPGGKQQSMKDHS